MPCCSGGRPGEDIRIEHAKRISEFELDGYALGGLAVGDSALQRASQRVVRATEFSIYSLVQGCGAPLPAGGKAGLSDGRGYAGEYFRGG